MPVSGASGSIGLSARRESSRDPADGVGGRRNEDVRGAAGDVEHGSITTASSQLPRAKRGSPGRPGAPIRAASRSSPDHHRPASPAHRKSAYPGHHRLPSPPHEVDAQLGKFEETRGPPQTAAPPPTTGRTPELSGAGRH